MTHPNFLHQKDENGRTPLHEAAVEGQLDVIAFLLEHGAEINAPTDLGSTPLLEAYKAFGLHSQVYKVLKQHGGKLIEPYDGVSGVRKVDVKYLLLDD